MAEHGGKRAKRGQGEGSYTVLPDGRVRWRVMVTTQAGERRAFSGTGRNLTEARKAVREVRRYKELGELPPRERLTVGELVGEYITARERSAGLKQRTAHDYRYTLAHYITPSLGHLKAQGVTGPRLRQYFDALSAGPRGDRTREKVHALLRAAYRWGVREGLVISDPTDRGRPARSREAGASKLQALDPEQAVKFYRAARADRWGWPLAFMLALGLRPGECLGLRWDDVTFHADGTATVKIERTLSVAGGELGVYVDTPKTERGRRVLMVTGDAVNILRDAQARRDKEAGARLRYRGHTYQMTAYVFTTQAGTPYRPDNLRRPLRRLSEAAGVPVLSPHKLRHSYTSVQAALGVPLEVLSKQLGHADPEVTRRVYRQVFDVERAGLTFDPVTPVADEAPREPRRVVVKARRATARSAEPQDPPSAAPTPRAVKSRGKA